MTDLNKVLVTGAGGMLAQDISFGVKLSHAELDVTDVSQIANICNKVNPSAILCLSSIDIRACEQKPLEAYRVNVLGPYNLTQEARKRNIPMILISTGAVFSGDVEAMFTPSDTPNPVNIYGQTKYLAELMVKSLTNNCLIVRTGWLFGAAQKKGFTAFIDKTMEAASKGGEIRATNSHYGSPTYMGDFQATLASLIKDRATGVIHLVNSGRASAADVAQHIIDSSKSRSLLVRTILSENEIPKRSKSEALSQTVTLRIWQAALDEYLHIQR
mgnify:CR=1 FL=1